MDKQKGIKILTYFYLIPFSLMILFNIFNSLLRTTYFDLYQDMETARYRWDNPLLLLAMGAGLLALIVLIQGCNWSPKGDIVKFSVGFSGALCLFVVLLFRCEVSCDSGLLSDIAIEFLQGNYRAFEQGEYLYRYSFQIGLVALLELIYEIFGVENFIVFQLINIICIMIIVFMLNKITWELFEDERICTTEAFLAIGMLPLFLFATFVYGDIIGWAFGVCSIYFIIRYLRTDRWQNIGKAAVLLSFGIVVKSNINILVVAAVIAILLQAAKKGNYRMLVWIAGLVLISQAGMVFVEAIYVNRAGLDEYPRGIPKIAWIAMSMQEGDEGGYACGWYNAYNWNVYGENGFDRAKTSQACMENLGQSLKKFWHEQRYAIDYFYKKFTSQWNAPTFQAMITNEWNSRHVENLSPLAGFFIYGYGRNFLYDIMNFYHFFMFLCSGVYCRFLLKKWSLEKAYYVLNIFGGFLFHMLWEAQSRYILGYFVLMLPIGACGLVQLTEGISKIPYGKKRADCWKKKENQKEIRSNENCGCRNRLCRLGGRGMLCRKRL